jgi:hypothetical protein
LILTLTFKTPDVLSDAIDNELQYKEYEEEYEREGEKEKLEKICHRWIQYGEYVTVEIDTEKRTAKVV